MILLIGGSYQGKTEYARENFKEKRILNGFHMIIKEMLENGSKIDLSKILENYDVVISDEIGNGIVPLDKFERLWREETGRALCEIAKASDEVYRIYAGIPVRIK